MSMAMICLALLSNKLPELPNIYHAFIAMWNLHFKGCFDGPTLAPMRRKKPADLWKINQRDQFNRLADQYFLSFHHAVVTDLLLANTLKPTNSVSKNR